MLVTVESFSEPWEAHLFRTRLLAEGIAASVAHEHHVGIDWPYATALGGVKVQVPETEVALALEVIRRCRNGEYQAELDAAFGAPEEAQCPFCAGTRFSRRRPPAWILALLASFFAVGVIFPVPRSGLRCDGCGATWRPGGLST